jgi:hypothetical protein
MQYNAIPLRFVNKNVQQSAYYLDREAGNFNRFILEFFR